MQHRRFAAVYLLLLLMLAGCSDQWSHEPGWAEDSGLSAPVTIENEHILDADGALILSMDMVPTRLAVDEVTAFAASGRFIEASVSPDGQWLAIVTAGTAHSGGWIKAHGNDRLYPAAFQYGGEIEIGPWRSDNRYVAFVERGPAGGQAVSLVAVERLGSSVQASSIPVQRPGDSRLDPEQRSDHPIGWDGETLLIERDGEQWRFEVDG